jgi:flavodoxin
MKKRVGVVVEILLYAIMLLQMCYVFLGNIPHEILGVSFFILLVLHIIFKRKWVKGFLKSSGKRSRAATFNGVIILCIFMVSVVMALSSMGVSRTVFPWFNFLQSPALHKYLATALLALSVIHGGMHFYIRSKKKKKTVFIIVLLTGLAIVLGLVAVPYINRHFRTVEIDYGSKVSGEKIQTENTPLVIYFTRVGNTDFEADVDVVSGASLLKADGIMMGNTELMAHMIRDILGSKIIPITLTGEKYPSSYSDTVVVAGRELKNDARPEIEDIDISDSDSIILIYPLWWGTIPMPVATFLEDNDFDGKKLYLLTTQGSAGFGSSISDVTGMTKGAEIIKGLSIYCDDIPDVRDELEDWISKEFGSDKGNN